MGGVGSGICSECWGTDIMLGFKTSLHGSALLGNNSVQHLDLDLSYLQSLCRRYRRRRQCPWKGTVPITDGARGPLAKHGLSLSQQTPDYSCTTITCFCSRTPGDATDVTHGCILEPRREHSFHTANLFFFSLQRFLLSSFNIINKGDDIISLAKTPTNAQTVFNTGTQRDFFTI